MDILQQLNKREAELAAWLKENAPECEREQKHLDANTPEQAYWHFGYLSGISDALRLLSRDPSSEGTSSWN